MPRVEYLSDSAVDDATDAALRELLSTCFTGPADQVFRERRWFREPPAHRWLIRDSMGHLVAHTAVHEKTVAWALGSCGIGGVAEVCVHPCHRHQGLVKAMLATAHAWMRSRQLEFSVLFGNPRVYGSSGYREVHNLFVEETSEGTGPRQVVAMVHTLGEAPWPSDRVLLYGPSF